MTATFIKFVTDSMFAPKINELQKYLSFGMVSLQFENIKVTNIRKLCFQGIR